MRRLFGDPAIRRGVYDGLIIAALIAIVVVLSVVVFPAGPDESDSDPEYVVQLLLSFAGLAVLLMLVGLRARRRSPDRLAGLKAGVAAGVVIAVLVTGVYLAVNNLFFDIVSQQHDKRVAFAASGWTSMRAYINVTQVEGLVVLVPMLAIVGAALGLIGGLLPALARRRAAP
jgi:MYXO-CTERM domain-containing protein